MNVKEVLQRLFPYGTRHSSESNSIAEVPVWPADLFCAAATLLEVSGCHTFATDLMADREGHKAYIDRVEALAKSEEWVPENESVPCELQTEWQRLLAPDLLVEQLPRKERVIRALILLLAVADEACEGLGWGLDVSRDLTELQLNLSALMLWRWDSRNDLDVPQTLCEIIPPDRAVVLPKSMTTATGCTLRSLSHNLALLPATGIVKSEWTLGGGLANHDDGGSVRLLVVPFPFHIPAKSFIVSQEHFHSGLTPPAYFDLEQTWLTDDKKSPISGTMLFKEVVEPLLQSAEKEVGGAIHGIVIPEGALSEKVADELAARVAEIAPKRGIEFFITGVMAPPAEPGKPRRGGLRFPRPRNLAKIYQFFREHSKRKGAGVVGRSHAKHHRWCLDQPQVKRYGFDGLVKEKATSWWENIDVSERRLPFVAFRRDMSLSVLICEDLARSDPALPAIRSIGPNLVVALLMDGPQLLQRWPGRYAMGLADDPGSSVLTVTCAAMVDRSNTLERSPVRSIALWRDGTGHTQEVILPKNSHGVLLSLRGCPIEQLTMDHRTDKSRAKRLELFGTQPLSLAKVPTWL
ncbi:hypothetical protein [Cupriavidus pauculus]|uniref:hypothetical protein n=1 Tax=Cupriavidus pauculus TaxID=82633 RepID=UPI001FCFD0ED|nr:hypothetical protein [Cupriavidus pauculus]